MNPYYETIETTLINLDFKKEESSLSDFKAAFTRRKLLTSLVFLIQEVNDKDFNAVSMKNVITLGRQWCENNLNAMWFIKESGLNIVLLHHGQIDLNDIKGLIDLTGFHGTICQSITILDLTNGCIEQEKTLVVIGKVKKVLQKLKEISYMLI